MGVTHPSREECGRELMLMFPSNSKMSVLIFVLFVSVKNVETLTTTIQTAIFFPPVPLSHPPSFTVSLSLFYLLWLLPYSWADLAPSRQVRVQKHQPWLSVCIIHDLPLLTGQFFSIQILGEVQSGLHSLSWLLAIDHKWGTQVLNKRRGFMSELPR